MNNKIDVKRAEKMKTIPYEIQEHREADIQARLLHRLYSLGIEAHLEYKINGLRVDVVIIKDKDIICAIEVKDSTRPAYEKLIRTPQYQKYLSLGIPFFYCFGYLEIQDTIKNIQSTLC